MEKTHITKDEINLLPIAKFEGKIEIIDTLEAADKATAKLSKYDLLGFDTETKPAFQKGVFNDVSLVQLATLDTTYLFRLNKIGLTKGLKSIFTNQKIQKIGLALRDDVKDLRKLSEFEPAGFIELSELTKELGIVNAGARGLAGLILGVRISKTQQTSNWENELLTKKQIDYAATDAWVCLAIFSHLQAKGYLD